ncbi:TPA: MFS transporter [Pseudomonas aeruginosa]
MSNAHMRGWWIVLASAIGIGFSSVMFFTAGYSMLSAGLTASFGWGVSELALGASIFLSAQALGYPIGGRLIDRWGSLRVIQVGLFIFALELLLLSLIGSLTQFYLVLFVMGLTTVATHTAPYLRVISLWFDRSRGKAIGIAASGAALGAVCFPLLIQHFIEWSDWSDALLVVAAIELFVCLPIMSLMIRVPPTGNDSAFAAEPVATDKVCQTRPTGMSLKMAMRTTEFWLMVVIFFVAGAGTLAVTTNAVQILTASGALDLSLAASVIAVAGGATLIGRLLFGFLLDHFNPLVLGFIAAAALSLGWLGWTVASGYWLLMLLGILWGIGSGGENDLLPYLTLRWFGGLHFGTLYGVLAGSFFLGAALGPVSYAALAVATSSVTTPIVVLAVANGIAACGFLFLNMRRSAVGTLEHA